MRLPVYLVCAALVVAIRATGEDTDAGAATPYYGNSARLHAEEDNLGYLVPRLSAKYRAPAFWNEVAAPRMYYVPEYSNALNSQDLSEQDDRFKRAGNGPSLSIVNPMDVLRQRLLLEIARRQLKESDRQVAQNRMMLNSIGKRGPFLRQPSTHHGNAISYDNM